jgi:hypothetical protein
MEITEVVFRKFQGEIVALFPYEIADHKGSIMSYAHIGQHSAADFIIYSSKLATEIEYHDLHNELTQIGYNLKVIKKVNYKRYNTTRKNIRK